MKTQVTRLAKCPLTSNTPTFKEENECAHLRSDRPVASFIHESRQLAWSPKPKWPVLNSLKTTAGKYPSFPYSRFSGKSSMLVKETIILEGPNFHSAMNSTEPRVLTGNLLCQVSQPIPLPTSLARNRNLPIYKD